MTMKLAPVLLLALVAGILAVGCGGGDDSGGDGVPGITQASDEGNGGGDEDGGGGGLPGIASGDDCEQLTSLGQTLSQALSAGDTKDLEEQARFFEDFANNTPEEIREDFQTVAEFYSKLTKALADANIEPGQEPDPEAIQALQEAAQSVDQERLTEASTNIEKWVKENCQINQ